MSSITVEEFERTRVARFSELEGSKMPMLDAIIPGCEREIYQIIGQGVAEDPQQKVQITDNRYFSCALVKCDPGKGTLHHDHKTNEVFMPLSGRWKIFWGENEDLTHVVLDKWDVASCPPNVMRGFRNIGDQEALLLVIVGGTDPGKVEWRQDVLEDAAKRGNILSDGGLISSSPKC